MIVTIQKIKTMLATFHETKPTSTTDITLDGSSMNNIE
jgi:hypothetical protein